MEKKIIWLVGNKFEKFATNENVISITEFERLVDQKNIKEAQDSIYYIGQGICLNRLNTIFEKIVAQNLHKYFVFWPHTKFSEKKNKEIVHKSKDENVLISTPLLHNNLYCSYLMTDDRCAEMSDHVTGQHLQGMLLIEAARQMMTAVTEKYILSIEQKNRMRFTLEQLDVTFKNYVFPLSVLLEYQILKIEKVNNIGFKGNSIVSFIQAEKEVCNIAINFSVFEKKFIEQMEKRSLNNVFQYYNQANETVSV